MSSTAGMCDHGGGFNPAQVLSGTFENLQTFIRESVAETVGRILRENVTSPESLDTIHRKGPMPIAGSRNQPNRAGLAVIHADKIDEKEVTDPRIRSRLFCPMALRTKEVDFNSEGYCAGMSTCFLLYYFHTKKYFTDPGRQMRLLGKQFEQGAGMLPVFLQRFVRDFESIGGGKLMDLEIEMEQSPSVRKKNQRLSSEDRRLSKENRQRELICKRVHEWHHAVEAMTPTGKSKPELLHQLESLEVGAYFMPLPHHMTAYVKSSSTQSFFLNPNRGLQEINGADQGYWLCKLMCLSWDRIKSKYPENKNDYMAVIRVHPRSCWMGPGMVFNGPLPALPSLEELFPPKTPCQEMVFNGPLPALPSLEELFPRQN